MNKKLNVLFIKDEKSELNLETKMFTELFSKVDFVQDKEEVLKYIDENSYDIVVGDLTIDPTKVEILKQIKDKKLEHIMFAMLSPKDTAKLYSIADLGVNAFELTSEQFEQALEAIANFDPYAN